MSANVALTDSFDQWRVKTNEVVAMTQTDGMSNFIKILDTTQATSNTTGSIITAGGLGILKSVVIGENLRIHGNVITDGDTTISGNLVFGDAETDQVTFTADINSNMVPNANLTFNMGNTTMFWANTWTGHVGVTQKSDSGKPAITVNSQDADVDGVRITASQDAANVFHINAHSLTEGTGITVLADGLTTGSAFTIDSNAGAGTRNVVEIINNNAAAVAATPLYVRNDSTNTVAKFIGQSTIVIPAGTTAQRGPAVQGGVRYNSQLTRFEGYSGSSWQGFGGLIDSDEDTKILAETSLGADNDDLDFYTLGTQRMKIDQTGLITVGVDGTGYDVIFYGDTIGSNMTWDQSEDAILLTDDTAIRFGDNADMRIYHDGTNSHISNAVGTLKIANATSGIAILIGHSTSETTIGDNLTVTGELTVQGTTSTINSTTLDVDDKNITMGSVATPSDTTADGGGLTLKGATDKTILWTNSLDSWVYNQGIQVGEDGTGHDVKFFGDTTSRYMLWDESEDLLRLSDSTKLLIGNDTAGDMTLYHDATNSYITNKTGALKLATETSGIAVTIGHSTSMVTIGEDLTVTDTLTELSMREMKTNISNMENMLPSVLQMQGVQFDWKKDDGEGLNHYGFIAEDVDKILPNLVSHDSEGKAQGIQYTKMTAVLLEAIKEQQVQIEELKSKIGV